MDRTKPAVPLVAAALLVIFGTPARAEKVERLPIVDRAIEFHGGDMYARSHSRFKQCSRGGCFKVSSRVDGGLFEHDAERESDGSRVRVTNDTVERWQNSEPVEIEDEQRWRDWVNQRVYFPFLPNHLNDPSVYKEDHGVVEWYGRRLHRVKVSFEPDSSSSAASEFLYWFDPESGRLEQFAYSFEGSPGGLRFRRASNFRRVGGILFSDSENLGIDADGLSVDAVDERYVAERMRPISFVTLEDIDVRRLDED